MPLKPRCLSTRATRNRSLKYILNFVILWHWITSNSQTLYFFAQWYELLHGIFFKINCVWKASNRTAFWEWLLFMLFIFVTQNSVIIQSFYFDIYILIYCSGPFEGCNIWFSSYLAIALFLFFIWWEMGHLILKDSHWSLFDCITLKDRLFTDVELLKVCLNIHDLSVNVLRVKVIFSGSTPRSTKIALNLSF